MNYYVDNEETPYIYPYSFETKMENGEITYNLFKRIEFPYNIFAFTELIEKSSELTLPHSNEPSWLILNIPYDFPSIFKAFISMIPYPMALESSVKLVILLKFKPLILEESIELSSKYSLKKLSSTVFLYYKVPFFPNKIPVFQVKCD